jgi:hypothetical protein
MPFLSAAQISNPLNGSPFAGVNNIGFNPAGIAGSRVNLDIALAGASMSLYNNYLAIDRDVLFKGVLRGSEPYDTANFANTYLHENTDNHDRWLHLNASALLPSFTATFDNGHAFGTHARVTSVTQLNGVPNNLAKLAYEGFNYPSLWGLTLNSEDLELLTAAWTEYGFTYAGLIQTSPQHSIRVGGTLKVLQGLAAAYVEFNDLSFSLQDIDTVSFLEADVSYGHSDNLDFDNGGFSFRLRTPFSVGLDFGVIYDYKPSADGDRVISVGLALVDAGRIRFDKGTYSQDFHADIGLRDVQGLQITSLESLDDSVASLYTVVPTSGDFVVQLPTHVNLSVDYTLYHGIGLNAAASLSSFSASNGVHRLSYRSSISFIPRYENKWVGVYVPLSMDAMNRAHLGLTARLGPLIVGTSDVLNFTAKRSIFGLDAHAYVKVTIPMGSQKVPKPKRVKPVKEAECPTEG